MKLLNVVLIVILGVILINISNSNHKIKNKSINSYIKDNHKPNKDDIITVTEEDILIENRGRPVKIMGNFPIPQSTNESKSLSTNYPEDLSIITRGATISNDDVIEIDRGGDKQIPEESYYPKYYLKDKLSGNTIGSTEYKFAEVNNLKSSYAWSDKNVSQYPNYYSSQLKDEITNIGAFFDINNNFVDTSTPRTDASVGEICYKSREGENVCLDNSKQYMIPPSLITNKSNCGFLNSIGLLEFSNMVKTQGEKVNNGGKLYGNVRGSKKYNEVYSAPLQSEVLTCQI